LAHQALKSAYTELTDRLNRFPQGATTSDLLYKILKMLFDEREAGLVAQLPIKPFTAEKAAKIWHLTEDEARKILNKLAGRALLIDIERKEKVFYSLPPPMAGFFEFSLMRIRGDLDQKVLSELFYQYLNEEEDFIKTLFTDGETQLGRVFVQEPVLSNDNALHVLDYERASQVIHGAFCRGIGVCYCRHKMQHLEKACDAPMNICMTFNMTAKSLVKHSFAREIDVAEGMDLLQMAYQKNLVQFGENVRKRVSFICNCCGCCCEALIAQRRFGLLNPIHTTNFVPQIDYDKCTGCGKCVEICPVEAMILVSANNSHKPKLKKAVLQEELCLGCGICLRNCTKESISLHSRPDRVITPLDSTHRVVMMAIERGKLQNLIFDNRALWSHRTMAAILGVILNLSPVKKAMASQQMKSRYLETLISRMQA
jgi:NAD-dependent dihydropyrimidine dehydrogenase PreA subunit